MKKNGVVIVVGVGVGCGSWKCEYKKKLVYETLLHSHTQSKYEILKLKLLNFGVKP